MKKLTAILTSIILFAVQFCIAQQITETETAREPDNSIFLEAGINFSVPVHIQMYRSHRVGIGLNARAAKRLSPKTELGIRAEYDYRFARNISPDLSDIKDPFDEIKKRALCRNYGLIAVKPNVQFYFRRQWFLGLESGVGYAISDENSSIGLGFVSEYGGNARFGWCSGIYLGKYFSNGNIPRQFGISLNLTNFVLKAHAENILGLKFNYCFNK
ncbi:MAG TPA: hypothetical protein VIH09_10795 [Flavobacterium sp.]|uniref:hypothetical protein n=1 Tax=Flavobacterium sp. TaxID=239 RepID=UPI002F4085B3